MKWKKTKSNVWLCDPFHGDGRGYIIELPDKEGEFVMSPNLGKFLAYVSRTDRKWNDDDSELPNEKRYFDTLKEAQDWIDEIAEDYSSLY